MTVAELTMNMYYAQKIRIYEVNKYDALKKTLIADIVNSQLLSDIYNPVMGKQVIGFGTAEAATIDINIKEE